ncbi:ABC transporter permease [Aeromicrobium wangtongii]|uniref:ABC transporter permease n=1 Tax=Aeromicrobium wangtongii TaxID=2969247 RepID=UPI002016CAE1|nr:FtsX-like permease family protein [Aeromicrobium wangtongii]MCL3820364.1 FtsX-like permease family protein [Aeromicrobium wangtongii]
MLRFTLRGAFARKIRLVLSASAIVLGVAFLAGSLTFTAMIGHSFDNIVGGSASDGLVRPITFGASAQMGDDADSRTLPASLADRLARTKGVARADGNVESQGLFIVKKNGKLLGGSGAPTLSLNYTDAPNVAGDQSITISSGRAPTASGEIALDERSARKAGYAIGDTVPMITTGSTPRVTAELVGYAEFAGGGLAGATLVLFDTRAAQDLFLGGQDAFTSISLTATPGTSQEQLVRSVRPLLPDGVQAVTGDKVIDQTKAIIDTILGYLNTFLLVFAGIALVVGSFLIVNTFAILVAQRSRELALLRALGASRRQVSRSVLIEAAMVGVVGSTAGLGLGLGLAALLRAVFANFGLDLSGTSITLSVSTVVVSYVVGIGVTMVAAWLPARRASLVSPVAAMRDEAVVPEGSGRRRLVAGIILLGCGAVLLALGLTGSGTWNLVAVGAGALALIIAATLTSPVLAVPFMRPIGGLYRRAFKAVGQLATTNTIRNPRRTAATSSALMIGLALVTTMSILGASMSKSIDVTVKDQFSSDFLVSNALLQPFSPTVGQQIAEVPGVGKIAETQMVTAKIGDSTLSVSATDLAALKDIIPLDFVRGRASVGTGEIALEQDLARSLGARPGDVVPLRFASGTVRSRVTGIYESNYLLGEALIPFSTLAAANIPRTDTAIVVDAAPGARKAAVGKALETATLDYPTVTVQTQEEYSESQRSQVDQVLYLVYALLGLAIVIAALGIVNTLALSVVERTREVGLLRAVGLSRSQLRRMIRLEAVAIAALGACLGIALGLLFGFVLQRVVADEGIANLAIPWTRLAVFVVVAVLVGVVAAVVPARRAARLDVVKAIVDH